MTYWPIPKVEEMKTTWHSLSTSSSHGSALEAGTFCVFIPHGYTCVYPGGSQRVIGCWTPSSTLDVFDRNSDSAGLQAKPRIELQNSGRVFVVNCFLFTAIFFSPYQGEARFTIYPDLQTPEQMQPHKHCICLQTL